MVNRTRGGGGGGINIGRGYKYLVGGIGRGYKYFQILVNVKVENSISASDDEIFTLIWVGGGYSVGFPLLTRKQ